MGEPRLEDISDYDNLKGEKKRVVWAVVIAGLLMGVIYVISYKIYDNKEETIQVKEKIRNIPVK
jgi:hypothetical protein